MKYWLMKSEPEVYGIDELEKDTTTWWEGVRNYQARNFMRDDMKVGDLVLFYHSNAMPPLVTGIAGVAQISKTAEPDKTQFQKKSEFFDPKAKLEAPPWVCPQIEFVEKFAAVISLEQLRAVPELATMALMQKGQRLSVQPVTREHFELIRGLAAGTSAAKQPTMAKATSSSKTTSKVDVKPTHAKQTSAKAKPSSAAKTKSKSPPRGKSL